MDVQDFAELEAKISRVLDRLDVLKKENAELRERLDESQRLLARKSEEIERLRGELNQALENARDPEKEAELQGKVSSLLDRLEQV
ncbi:cell division protein ZapB [bacterium]|nr:cell division protein ZapB [bacterium]